MAGDAREWNGNIGRSWRTKGQRDNLDRTARAARVVHLARTIYEGANHTHLSELLGEHAGIVIGRTTLRRILVNAGLSSPGRRRPPKHRVRRQRMPREGMLVQLDGSHHRWLGEDGPQCALLFAVDDATGCVANALFCEQADSLSYFRLIQSLIQRRASLSPSILTAILSSSTARNISPPPHPPRSDGQWRSRGPN